MVSHKYTVILEPAEKGGYIVKSMELPVASEGETKEEAIKNIKEAIECYLEAKTETNAKKKSDKVTIRVLPEVTVSKEGKRGN